MAAHPRSAPLRAALAGCLLLAACGPRTTLPPSEEAEPSRARAALASLFVDNRTRERLTILYRFANRGAPDVGIGHVAPGELAELAPVPAGEPLILIARDAAGRELSVGPRTFPLDGSWTWRIERAPRQAGPAEHES